MASQILVSLGVDAMGGAFALLDANGELLGNPRYSRLPQQAGVLAEAYKRVEPAHIYRQTGLLPTKLNSLYGLLAMQLANSPLLDAANSFLMLPDLAQLLAHRTHSQRIYDCFNLPFA